MDEFKIPEFPSTVRSRPNIIEPESTETSTNKTESKSVIDNVEDNGVKKQDNTALQVSAHPAPIKPKSEKVSTPEAIFAALTYEEPSSSCPADPKYKIEVLKNGSIVDTLQFKDRSSYVVGRIPGCDIAAEHPTVSRIHAILQFIGGESAPLSNDSESTTDPTLLKKGLYIYDLNSTHGTFLNKNRLYPNRFYHLHVGHVLKFGNSSRLYIIMGPPEDEEEESSKTVTELIQERLDKELERKRAEAECSSNAGIQSNDPEENEGIDWGMGEDADEESDLRENPFAIDFDSSELNLDNPKKTLRGWFDREGCELVYDVREKANGQFLCTINLPIDGPNNRPVFAEVDVKGKKKDAVAQCALQACQILDKYGLLRQSHRENRNKRKVKNIEDEDFYSSDEDTYLDRTGSVEKKRQMRMRFAGKIEEKFENYESLSLQFKEFQLQIDMLNKNILKAERNSVEAKNLDPLDAFMMDLKSGTTDVKKMKLQLKELLADQRKIEKLMLIAKPCEFPQLVCSSSPPSSEVSVEKSEVASSSSPISNETHEQVETNQGSKEKDCSNNTKVHKLYGPKPHFKPLKQVILQSSSGKGENSRFLASSDEEEDAGDREKVKVDGDRDVDEDERHDKELVVGDGNRDLNEGEDHAVSDDECNDVSDNVRSYGFEKSPTGPTRHKKRRFRQYKKVNDKSANDYDINDPDYSVWLPPQGQSGDGRTSLNEKLGY